MHTIDDDKAISEMEVEGIVSAHRVPRLPIELLIDIMGYVDKGSLFGFATVNKEWSTVALDELWMELYSPLPLVALLGELSYLGGVWGTVGEITEANWTRFKRYAQRVRVLSYVDNRAEPPYNRKDSRISPTTFKMLHTHVGNPILPQLRRLSWHASTPVSAMQVPYFLTSRINYLSLHLNFPTADRVSRDLVAEIIKSPEQPKLETLGLNVKLGKDGSRRPQYNEQPSGPLATLLRNQERLRKVILHASFIITSDPFVNMCKLPALRALEIMFQGISDVTLESGMDALARGCPRLDSAQFCILRSSTREFYFKNLVPLLKCELMAYFQLHLRSQDAFIRLSTTDVEALARSWTGLKKFAITNWPDRKTSPDNASSLEILNAFATSGLAKTLEVLRLDFYLPQEPLVADPRSTGMEMLGRIDVGPLLLPTSKVSMVALFLAKLCPQPLALSAGTDSTNALSVVERSVWEAVSREAKRLLP